MTRPQRLGEISEAFGEQIRGRVEEIQPGLRGWLHAATFPVAVVAGVVLVVAAPTPTARVGAAVFAVSAALLFGVSAAYHRGHWSPRSFAVLRRIDHSSIFVLIAGTYTAFSLLLLTGSDRVVLLALVWTGAVAGVLFRVLWLDAPRWVYLPAYLGLGWVAVFWLGDFARTAGATVLVLIVLGGALYSLGGLVYGLRRPDPAPAWFGFHELFHTLTIAAFAVHYIGISMATYRLA